MNKEKCKGENEKTKRTEREKKKDIKQRNTKINKS